MAAIAFYMVGGSIGVMVAPVLVPRAAAADIRWVAALAVPGLLFAAFLCLRLRVEAELPRVKARFAHIELVFRRLWPIHLDVVLRFIPLTAYVLWLPVLAALRGQSKAEVGQSLAYMMLVGAVGVLAGGWIGVRLTGRRVVVLSEVLAAAALILAPVDRRGAVLRAAGDRQFPALHGDADPDCRGAAARAGDRERRVGNRDGFRLRQRRADDASARPARRSGRPPPATSCFPCSACSRFQRAS